MFERVTFRAYAFHRGKQIGFVSNPRSLDGRPARTWRGTARATEALRARASLADWFGNQIRSGKFRISEPSRPEMANLRREEFFNRQFELK